MSSTAAPAPLPEARPLILELSVLWPETECWVWFGALNDRNAGRYGRVWFRGARYYAHRLSYLAFCGPIPEGELVLHCCFNQCCVAPQHLKLGDQQQNVIEGYAAGVYPKRRQVRQHSGETKREVLDLHGRGYSLRFLGQLYDVPYQTVWQWVQDAKPGGVPA